MASMKEKKKKEICALDKCNTHTALTVLAKPRQEMNIALFLFHTPNHLMLYQDCWIQPNPRIVTCNKDAWPCHRRWQNLACWPGARVTALELMSLSNRFNNVQGEKKKLIICSGQIQCLQASFGLALTSLLFYMPKTCKDSDCSLTLFITKLGPKETIRFKGKRGIEVLAI